MCIVTIRNENKIAIKIFGVSMMGRTKITQINTNNNKQFTLGQKRPRKTTL